MTSTIQSEWKRSAVQAEAATPAGVTHEDSSTEYVRLLSSMASEIEQPLKQVEALLREQLLSSDAIVGPMLKHVLGLGGKRLRPMLLLLTARACGEINQDAIRLAVAVELVHTATLVHDDILDGAEQRRHRPTLHHAFHPQAALLVGDWLFTQAYHLANQTSSTLAGRWLAAAAKEVCEGEIRQTIAAGSPDMTIESYLEILGKKTGSLCAVSCSLGAWSSGADDATCQAFHRFGWKLGQAFQVHDDYLDYWGNPKDLGKPIGRDFEAGKITLPLLKLFQNWPLEQRQRFLDSRRGNPTNDFAKLLSLMTELDVEAYARSVAKQLCQEAIEVIPNFTSPSSTQDASLELLVRLADAAIRRIA